MIRVCEANHRPETPPLPLLDQFHSAPPSLYFILSAAPLPSLFEQRLLD